MSGRCEFEEARGSVKESETMLKAEIRPGVFMAL